MKLHLASLCALTLASAPPRTAAAQPPSSPDTTAPSSRLVVTQTQGLNFGLGPVPSGELALFLGASLSRRAAPAGHWVALGVQNSLSFGFADGAYGSPRDSDRRGLVSYRPLLVVQGLAGPRARLFYAAGLGPVFHLFRPWSDDRLTAPAPGIGVDVDARLGYVFTQRPGARLQGVVGGQLRLSGVPGSSPVPQPLPQFGVFLGFTRLPLAIPARHEPSPPRGDGRKLRLAGALSLGLSLPLILAGALVVTSGALREGPERPGAGLGLPLLVVGAASLLAGITMLAVGVHRVNARRAAQTTCLDCRPARAATSHL